MAFVPSLSLFIAEDRENFERGRKQARKREGKTRERDPSPHPSPEKKREGMKIERLGMKGEELLELASNIVKIFVFNFLFFN